MDTRTAFRNTKQEWKLAFVLLTVIEPCKTQLLTNVTPHNGQQTLASFALLFEIYLIFINNYQLHVSKVC